MGSFDISLFKSMGNNAVWGEIYLVIFVIISFIVLFNCMCAILFTRFDELEPDQLALYYDDLITILPGY
jgi:hypothetical protein